MLLVLAAGSAVAVASHYDESDYENGQSDFRIYTYGDPPAQQRAPGATDRSYWTESITYGVPEGEKVYLTETVTYRPIPSDCAPENTEEFGIDRDATNEGEREIDESATESVKSFSKDDDARDQYESEYGRFGRLTTTDWAYVERLKVEWYAPDDFGAPLEVYRGDRFVSAQRGCLDNPDAAGWYRFASINQGEFENGTEIRQEVPTYSHWFYICECANRQEAVKTLGPPPSERNDETDEAATPTPTATSGTATTSATVEESTDGEQESAVDAQETAVPTSTGTPTPSPTPTPTPTETAPGTPTADWDERVLQTPTAAQGTGFTPVVAVVAALVAVVGLRRRRR